MFYTIYQITNKINGKIYVGKHQTTDLNDSYMGSGKLLIQAIKKYGIDNFEKKILFVFENELDMNNKEKELVTEDFCKDNTNYNLNPGGKGGFGHINMNEPLRKKKNRLAMKRAKENGLDIRQKIGFNEYLKDKDRVKEAAIKKVNTIRERFGDKAFKTFLGQKHSTESIEKMSAAKKGKYTGHKNSQFGSMWITNGQINKKVKNDQDIPEGWHKGRI